MRDLASGIIFDGDDTLWLTEHLYDEARDRARLLVERSGYDGEAWERAQRQIDVANVDRFGHNPIRFPLSAVEALQAIGVPESSDLSSGVREAARSVFRTVAPVRKEAIGTLRALKKLGFRLALLTKGDPNIQRWRIDSSGLQHFFDVVRIVPVKSAREFSAIASDLGLDATELISIGNSVRSDIEPSLAAGIRAVWIPAHVWEYEKSDREEIPGVPRISSLTELSALIGTQESESSVPEGSSSSD